MLRELDSTPFGQTTDLPTGIEVVREGVRRAASGARIRDCWSALENEGGDGDPAGDQVPQALGPRLAQELRSTARGAARDKPEAGDAAEILHDRLASARQGHAGPRFERMAEVLTQPVADAVRDRLADGLRDRIDAVVREKVEEVLRERLAGTIRSTLAEQYAGDGIDTSRLIDAIHYRLADVLQARIGEGLRAG
jgi:hypothetical protein